MTRLSTISSFKINKYILLKLKNDNKTYIYVNGKKFRQCSYLLFIIDDLYKVKDFKSIDEVSDELISKENKIKINPLDEFWGHCSNLQAWAENNYDTRLLHSNLAFPLLKTLSDEGDKKAEKVFKEEIAKRYLNGPLSTRIYLIEQRFLYELTKEERELLFNEETIYNFYNEKTNISLGLLEELYNLGYEKALIFLKQKIITSLQNKNKFMLDNYPYFKRYFKTKELYYQLINRIQAKILLKIEKKFSIQFQIVDKITYQGNQIVIKNKRLKNIFLESSTCNKNQQYQN